jgi:hypothetical protein
MALQKVKKGDRIRLKVRTLSGWKGIGIVTEDQVNDSVWFRKEGLKPSWLNDSCACSRHECALIREKRNHA